MANLVNMPRLGLTMTEGIITKWLKNEGDPVKEGEVFVEIESDKSIVPHESPESGTILKILAPNGATVKIYAPIAIVGEPGESIDDLLQEAGGKDQAEKESETVSVKDEKEGTNESFIQEVYGNRPYTASPAARRIASEHQVDIDDVALPEGQKRVESKDVLAFIESGRVRMTPVAAKMAAERGIEPRSLKKPDGQRVYSTDIPSVASRKEKSDRHLEVKGIRKVIADRMRESVDLAVHVALNTEVDMTNIVELRNHMIGRVQEKYQVKLSYNDIIIKCVSMALRENPRINCYFTGGEVIEKGNINIGIAVALDEGLVVPVIRDADELTIGEIALESRRLIEKSQAGTLLPDEYNQGTFTVSNLGMYSITSFNSIINQPESAILSVGMITKKPVVVNDEIDIRPIMNMTINFDHRPIDGSTAAVFLKRLKELLEEPHQLLV